MYKLLKQQERRNKIPAGIPDIDGDRSPTKPESWTLWKTMLPLYTAHRAMILFCASWLRISPTPPRPRPISKRCPTQSTAISTSKTRKLQRRPSSLKERRLFILFLNKTQVHNQSSPHTPPGKIHFQLHHKRSLSRQEESDKSQMQKY